MHITVDDRERASGLFELLEDYFEIEVSRLSCGDYLINNRITVERKSDRDFLVSIIDLRLFRQVANLKNNCANSILLLEGNPFQTDLKFDPQAIKGALLSIQAIWQVPVVFSRSKEDSRDILVMIGRQYETDMDVMPLRGGHRPKRLKSKQLYVLQGLPEVGPTLAKRLLQHFRSVGRVLTATVDELIAVQGVGKARAEKIRDILDRTMG